MMPEVPEGFFWDVIVDGDYLIVKLVFESDGTASDVAKESKDMCPFGRDYWGTTGAESAVTLAKKIMRRVDAVRNLKEQLGVSVRLSK